MAHAKTKELGMITGHFGLAAWAKSREPSTPLWALMMATVWLDLAFLPLFLVGWERIEPLAQPLRYGGALIHAEYTHSLVGMLILSALLALLCRPWLPTAGALAIFLVSASHWCLDVVVHRADMPILPANVFQLPLLGMGMWQHPSRVAALEAIILVGGVYGYWRAARGACQRSEKTTTLADAAASFLLLSGFIVLYLDITSVVP